MLSSAANLQLCLANVVRKIPWVNVTPGSPYFQTDDGVPWSPVGQNDSIEWPEFRGLFRRRDVQPARDYLRMLADSGVTVLRLMLEYCHHDHRFLERPAGRFVSDMVRLWDDLLALCVEHNLRVLLTPYDTFWMWLRWEKHPYSAARGGPCADRSHFFVCPETRRAVKRRLDFATERWGGSGVIFAWDLWNELHPSYGMGSVVHARDFIADVGEHLRQTEMRLQGRSHLQTASVFLPILQTSPALGDVIYRSPELDFASTHFYEEGTIDHPKNTVAPAIGTGRLVMEALQQTQPERPFFDSEHGPIHTFKDHHRTLPEDFDDEYFRHIQWAHFASGGAGGAMRWPNRKPHSLTAGMRRAQNALARFLPCIDWNTFRRCNWNGDLQFLSKAKAVLFGCGDENQAIIWILRTSPLRKNGMLDPDAAPIGMEVTLPWPADRDVRVVAWDTLAGCELPGTVSFGEAGGHRVLRMAGIRTDRAFALQRAAT